ncbi:MAG: glycoside hydrolase family 2 protein [Opitutales bacterium]
MIRLPCLALLLSLLVAVCPATTVNHLLSRARVSLDGKWNYIVDPYDSGYYDYRSQPFDASPNHTGGYFQDRRDVPPGDFIEYGFDRSPTLTVPRDWNTQDSRLFHYEGTVWYRRLFDWTPAPHSRVFLHFSAANYQADVYLNARKLGHHTGGFTPFDFEVTGFLKDHDNSIVVRVDNRRQAEGVPTLNTDWWNYGGLTREVCLVTVPETFIADAFVQLDRTNPSLIHGEVRLEGPQAGQPVTVAVPELHCSVTVQADASGRAVFSLPVDDRLERWAPAHPRTYEVVVSCATDRLTDRIGFRTIEVRGDEILLNGKPVFLRGVCLHEENPVRGGRAFSPEDARLLLGWARQLGCNFVRLAHYPHNEYMARVADETGLLLWEEIPVYWTIHWNDPGTLANAKNQLGELIQRDRNRASVIVWSVANETPVGEERTEFLRALVGEARSLDSTRLVSAAMEVKKDPADPRLRIVEDPFGAYTDLLSFNEYVGWYDGNNDSISRIVWRLKYDKPVIISEFGAEGLAGWHGPETTRFTEEYQARLYRETIAMLLRLPHFRGATPWILCDFRSPRRNLPGVQDGWNRKGLIGENGEKKQAFGVLQAFYEEMAAKPQP